MDGNNQSQIERQPLNDSEWVERRRYRRKPILWAAKLESSLGKFDCMALDISLGGARLRLAQPIELRGQVTLIFEKLGRFPAEIVSFVRTPGGFAEIGLRFREPAEAVEERLRGSALPLAPSHH